MNEPRVVLKKDHSKNCLALRAVAEHDWYSPWYLTGETFYGDVKGGSRGTTTNWLVFKCNATNCKAHGLVRTVYFENIIHDEVTKGSKWGLNEVMKSEK